MTTEQRQIPEMYGTFLISKPHRRSNFLLRRAFLLQLKHPLVGRLGLTGYDLLSYLTTILGGLAVAVVLSSLDLLFAFLGLFVGGYVTNRLFKWFMNRPSGTVQELNIFQILRKRFQTGDKITRTNASRIQFENGLRRAHRSYKRKLLKNIQRDVREDFELQNSRKLLNNVAKEFGRDKAEEVNTSLRGIESWAYETLDRVHKGTRLIFWNNVEAEEYPGELSNFIILSDARTDLSMVRVPVPTDELVDELTLLVFANRYSTVMAPLLQESSKHANAFEKHFRQYLAETKGSETYSENYAEAYRVLLSKTLGMQEVLKSTVRQIERLSEARDELAKEARLKEAPDLEQLADEYASPEGLSSFLEIVGKLRDLLSQTAANLRQLDFNKVPKGTAEGVKYITDFYVVLEKLRFMTTWFEDIASFTTIAGGVGYETGVLTTTVRHDPEVVMKVADVFKNFVTTGGTVYALRGVSLDVRRGEFLMITGSSGSGKTTLLNIMAGLDKPDRGAIYIEGQNLNTLSDSKLSELRRDKFGFIFQFYNLLPTLNNKENVAYPAEIGGNTHQLGERASANLRAVELQDFEKQFPNKLSGGQMQRVTIARSLINNPAVLFADEPTGDLDSVTGKQVMDFIAKFNKETGATVIMVTHDQGLLGYADRVITMQDGRVFEA